MTFESLKELLKAKGSECGEKLRPYRVTPTNGKPVYVASNSPGQAALAVCEVEPVSIKEQNAAYRELVGTKEATTDGV